MKKFFISDNCEIEVGDVKQWSIVEADNEICAKDKYLKYLLKDEVTIKHIHDNFFCEIVFYTDSHGNCVLDNEKNSDSNNINFALKKMKDFFGENKEWLDIYKKMYESNFNANIKFPDDMIYYMMRNSYIYEELFSIDIEDPKINRS